MVRALGVLFLAVVACKPAPGSDPEPPPAAVPSPPPAVSPSPSASAPARAADPGARAPAPSGPELQAGGRTLSWWGERLTALRKDGPPELYELAVQRARANGLKVNATGAEVTVQAGEGAGAKP